MEDILSMITGPLVENVAYVKKLQGPDGSFPWGRRGKGREHEKNVDMTCFGMSMLYNYGGLTDDVKLSLNYLLEEQKKRSVRFNPWLGYKEDPKISAVFVKSVAPIKPFASGIAEELDFIDSKISGYGEPQVPGEYGMQIPINAAFDILQAYSVSSRRDSEKAKLVESYVLGKQLENGSFNPKVDLHAGITDLKIELTAAFIDTGVNFLKYDKDSKQIRRAKDFLEMNRYKHPREYSAVALSIFNAFADLEEDLDEHIGLLSIALKTPAGISIEDDVHRTAQLVRLRNKLTGKSEGLTSRFF